VKLTSNFFLADSTIIGLRSEITKLLSNAEELELMRHFKDEYEKTDKENARYSFSPIFQCQAVICCPELYVTIRNA